MKLLFCSGCQDVIKLSRYVRSCACAQTFGQYDLGGVTAWYEGELAVPLAIPWQHLGAAMQVWTGLRSEVDTGIPFEAFVVPDRSRTFIRRESRP